MHKNTDISIVGKKFGRLFIISHAYTKRRSFFNCLCDCGKEKVLCGSDIKKGTKSCGCLAKENMSRVSTTHGGSKEKLFNTWCSMKKRCYNPKHKSYKYYGGRGIIICDEWINSYEVFRCWSLANGYAEKLSIDRKNNDGNYEPSNCRWVTDKVQHNNTRANHPLTYNGVTKNVTQWAEELGVSDSAIFQRISKGWSVDKIFTKPFLGQQKLEYNGLKLTINEWAKKLNIRRALIDQRLKRNWTVEQTLFTKPDKTNRIKTKY